MGRGKKKQELPNDGNPLYEKFYDGRMNVCQYVDLHSNDDGFVPVVNEEFTFTDFAPGSYEKICVLAYRVRRGLPLFHPLDAPNNYGWTPKNYGWAPMYYGLGAEEWILKKA